MHGLMNRSLQNFIRDVYGQSTWQNVVADSALDFEEFEALLTYDDALTRDVLHAACRRLQKSPDVLLEDLGIYLVSHPNTWRIRRLLRFGGANLTDFIESLNDLADRACLAVSDLILPDIRIAALPSETPKYLLTCDPRFPGMEYVALGCLRAMADDYGALATVDLLTTSDNPEATRQIEVTLLSTSFAAGNSFVLARRAS